MVHWKALELRGCTLVGNVFQLGNFCSTNDFKVHKCKVPPDVALFPNALLQNSHGFDKKVYESITAILLFL